MTKESDPTGIPSSLGDLLNNNSTIILIDRFTMSILQNTNVAIYEESQLEKIATKTWPYSNSWSNIIKLSYPANDYKYLCSPYLVQFINDKESLRMYLNNFRTVNKNATVPICTQLRRFAWFYTTSQRQLPKFGHKHKAPLYLKLLLLLMGEYSLIGNNEPAIFSELYVWYVEEDNYLTSSL